MKAFPLNTQFLIVKPTNESTDPKSVLSTTKVEYCPTDVELNLSAEILEEQAEDVAVSDATSKEDMSTKASLPKKSAELEKSSPATNVSDIVEKETPTSTTKKAHQDNYGADFESIVTSDEVFPESDINLSFGSLFSLSPRKQ